MSASVNKGWYRVVHLVGKTISHVSSVFTSGWNREQAHRLAEQLHRRLELQWADLLRAHHGHVAELLPPGGRAVFDYASCIVRFPSVEMLVSEGRGEVYLQLRHTPQEPWHDLTSVLHARTPKPQSGLAEFGAALAANWNLLAGEVVDAG